MSKQKMKNLKKHIRRKEQFEKLCNDYLLSFCKKHDYDIKYEFEHGYVWIGGRVGGVACIGDMFVSFTDIRYDLDYDVSEDMFEKWYWENLDAYEKNELYFNYENYCKGAPVKMNENEIEEKEKYIESLKEMMNDEIDNVIEKKMIDKF